MKRRLTTEDAGDAEGRGGKRREEEKTHRLIMDFRVTGC
jgi:hypothetical protein